MRPSPNYLVKLKDGIIIFQDVVGPGESSKMVLKLLQPHDILLSSTVFGVYFRLMERSKDKNDLYKSVELIRCSSR